MHHPPTSEAQTYLSTPNNQPKSWPPACNFSWHAFPSILASMWIASALADTFKVRRPRLLRNPRASGPIKNSNQHRIQHPPYLTRIFPEKPLPASLNEAPIIGASLILRIHRLRRIIFPQTNGTNLVNTQLRESLFPAARAREERSGRRIHCLPSR